MIIERRKIRVYWLETPLDDQESVCLIGNGCPAVSNEKGSGIDTLVFFSSKKKKKKSSRIHQPGSYQMIEFLPA